MNNTFPNIKTIIFDLGGVLLNIDYHLTIKAFESLGVENFEQTFSQFKQSNFSDLYETGKISSKEFYKLITKGTNITFFQFENAWNAMLLNFPVERIQLLENLSKKYTLFLCSNTNEIHYNAFQKIIGKLNTSLDDLFTTTYYSHKIGLRKPNATIFEFILNKNKLEASSTLFIDDSIQHIETAKTLDIKTIHATSEICLHPFFNK